MSYLSLFSRTAAAVLALVSVTASAQPETWPDGRNVRLIVAYPFGGISHLVAGALADRLAREWGTSVSLENLPGASGSTGMNAVAKAVPDGFTLGVGYRHVTPNH